MSKDYDVCSEPGGFARLAAINFCISMVELGGASSQPASKKIIFVCS